MHFFQVNLIQPEKKQALKTFESFKAVLPFVTTKWIASRIEKACKKSTDKKYFHGKKS